MKHLKIFLLACCMPLMINAQTETNFEVGYPDEPKWHGDINWFKIEPLGTLQLEAPSDAGEAQISTKTSFDPGNSYEWEIHFEMDFPPSPSNKLRIYLQSDSLNTKHANNAVFLQIGESGTDDTPELYYISDGEKNLILRGTDGAARDFGDILHLKVHYDTSGFWNLKRDTTLSGIYFNDASGTFKPDSYGKFFAFRCFFTSTRSDKFNFSYLYAGAERIDTLPPEIDTILPHSTNDITVFFNKPILQPKNSPKDHFQLTGSEIHPDSFYFTAHKPDQIQLIFDEPLPSRKMHTIEVSGIQGHNGVVNEHTLNSFIYFYPVRNEIVVTEIMFNPEPSVELPEREYIEVYNRTQHTVSLDGWQLANDNRSAQINDLTLRGGEYALLVPNAGLEKFKPFGNKTGITGWPGFKINGDMVILRDEKGRLLYSTEYERAWLNNEAKEEGGWALEMIDPENPCGGKENWKASKSQKGGTPGFENSVYRGNPDNSTPFIKKITPVDQHKLEVFFDQPLDSASAATAENYLLHPFNFSPDSVSINNAVISHVSLYFDKPLRKRQIYNLSVSNIQNCTGNNVDKNAKVRTAIPEQPERGDILLNELLFNTFSEGAPFIEIVNASKDKVFDFSDLKIGSLNENSGSFTSKRQLSESLSLFYPGEFRVLTLDPERVFPFYETGPKELFLQVQPFVRMQNEQGNIYLLTNKKDTVDRFHYHEDMHHDMLSDVSGVSLERIRPDRPTQSKHNWTSAAASAGFATPGLRNSQFRDKIEAHSEFKVEPPIFSINNPLLKDHTELLYKMDEENFSVTVSIYSLNGYKVKKLANNQHLAATGAFKWEGTDRNGRALPPGTYLFLIELINTKGEYRTLQLPVTLSE